MSKKLKYFIWTFFGLLIFFVLSLIVAIGAIIYTNQDYIYKNIYINNVDVSGLTKEDANTMISNKFKLGKLQIKYGEEKWVSDLQKMGFSYDTKKAVDDAYSIGRNDNIFANMFEIACLYIGNFENVNLAYSENDEELKKLISNIAEKMDSEPIQAIIDAGNGKVTVKAGRDGKKVKQDELLKNIKDEIKSVKNNDISVGLPLQVTSPKLKYEQLKHINGMITSYRTRYSMGYASRAHNIAVAANKVDRQILMPNEEVSFLKKLGNVTVKDGFSYAKVIINKKYVDGVGGGVCQVSSTLYNALLQSGIKILERTPHTFPSGYVPMGRDATVADGAPDLKYKNEYDFPVYIRSYAGKGVMVTEVYGDVNRARKVQIYSTAYGTNAVTYAVEDGKTTVISRDRYMLH